MLMTLMPSPLKECPVWFTSLFTITNPERMAILRFTRTNFWKSSTKAIQIGGGPEAKYPTWKATFLRIT